jgi:cytochrome c553
MKPRLLLLVPLALIAAMLVLSPRHDGRAQQKVDEKNKAMIERGKWLVEFGGCHDCHSPKKMTPQGPKRDETRLLSGHPADEKLAPIPAGIPNPQGWVATTNMHLSAWAGPWGVSFTSNLTPDVATGLGSWTEEIFIKALRTGKHMGEGRDILPPMPWYNYGQASDDDLKAIFAFLRSLPPIKNPVPDPIPPAMKH